MADACVAGTYFSASGRCWLAAQKHLNQLTACTACSSFVKMEKAKGG
jgi:hypothetical protein